MGAIGLGTNRVVGAMIPAIEPRHEVCEFYYSGLAIKAHSHNKMGVSPVIEFGSHAQLSILHDTRNHHLIYRLTC